MIFSGQNMFWRFNHAIGRMRVMITCLPCLISLPAHPYKKTGDHWFYTKNDGFDQRTERLRNRHQVWDLKCKIKRERSTNACRFRQYHYRFIKRTVTNNIASELAGAQQNERACFHRYNAFRAGKFSQFLIFSARVKDDTLRM